MQEVSGNDPHVPSRAVGVVVRPCTETKKASCTEGFLLPTYKTTREKLASTIAAIEKKNEDVIQVVAVGLDGMDELAVITRGVRDSNDGFLPSWAKETR